MQARSLPQQTNSLQWEDAFIDLEKPSAICPRPVWTSLIANSPLPRTLSKTFSSAQSPCFRIRLIQFAAICSRATINFSVSTAASKMRPLTFSVAVFLPWVYSAFPLHKPSQQPVPNHRNCHLTMVRKWFWMWHRWVSSEALWCSMRRSSLSKRNRYFGLLLSSFFSSDSWTTTRNPFPACRASWCLHSGAERNRPSISRKQPLTLTSCETLAFSTFCTILSARRLLRSSIPLSGGSCSSALSVFKAARYICWKMLFSTCKFLDRTSSTFTWPRPSYKGCDEGLVVYVTFAGIVNVLTFGGKLLKLPTVFSAPWNTIT